MQLAKSQHAVRSEVEQGTDRLCVVGAAVSRAGSEEGGREEEWPGSLWASHPEATDTQQTVKGELLPHVVL